MASLETVYAQALFLFATIEFDADPDFYDQGDEQKKDDQADDQDLIEEHRGKQLDL